MQHYTSKPFTMCCEVDGSEKNPIDSLNYRVLEQYIYILGCDVTGLTGVDIPTIIYGKGMQKFCDWFTTDSYMQGNRERDRGQIILKVQEAL